MLVRVVGRVLSARVLLIALVFFVALAVELGRWGGLQSFFSSVPFAADFALDYLANLTRGNLGTIAPTYASAPAVPVIAELARALPRSLGLLAVALALAVLVGMPLGIRCGVATQNPLLWLAGISLCTHCPRQGAGTTARALPPCTAECRRVSPDNGGCFPALQPGGFAYCRAAHYLMVLSSR